MDRTDGQKRALVELRAIERAGPYTFEVLADRDNAPNLLVDVTVSCANLERTPGGLPLRRRERLCIVVTPDFPFRPPSLWTLHRRFAGHPHVQWARHLCLYRASAVEWNPGDGMFGFVDRIATFFDQGARGELDALGAPLHPPVAYTAAAELVIPRANTPPTGNIAWLGLAKLSLPTARRVDIVGWTELEATADTPVAAAVLLADPMPFEFPTSISELLVALADRGVSRSYLVLVLMMTALQNASGAPLFVVIGTPMRGIAGETTRQQHLEVFRIEPAAAQALQLAACQYSQSDLLKGIGTAAEALFWTWAESAKASWCEVREDRPEVVVRRDSKTAASWFVGKTVALWGCGGLGSHIAEYLTRAGVRALSLHDSGKVAPGLLVRQQFSDSDIGYSKVEALERRLKAIRPDVLVTIDGSDLLSAALSGSCGLEGTDVVIDTTGSNAIAAALEHARKRRSSSGPTVASLTLDASAERGLVAIAPPEHSGSILDVVRRAKLEVCQRAQLAVYVDAFWPVDPLNGLVEPEPGCSSPTFSASAADVAQLSGALLNRLATALAESAGQASAHFLSRGDVQRPAAGASFALEADLCVSVGGSYELRLSSRAWKEMRGWIRKARREQGGSVETGGLLFGERDGAANILWVSEVSGPPRDSFASDSHFVCGTDGMPDLNREKRSRSRGAVSFIGMWHTHPGGAPVPSLTDLGGMRQIISADLPSTPESLLLIVGGDLEREPILGASLFSRPHLAAL